MGEYAEDAFRGWEMRCGVWRELDLRGRYEQRAAKTRAAPGSPLAAARSAAHAAFDPLWKDGHMRRITAYVWLAKELDLGIEDCHIAFFDEEQCRRVADLANVLHFQLETGL